jgi:osmotically-inducible protein OsmY
VARLTNTSTALVIGVVLVISSHGCSTLTGSEPGVRTPGATLDDQVIERLARQEVRKADPALEDAQLVIVSHNGVVLMAGTVARADLRETAQGAVQRLSRVKQVHNELVVAEDAGLGDRSLDSWLTGQVKVRLIGRSDVDAGRINVTTYRRVVYLMGRVPRSQADGAVAAAQNVRGVAKIVKVFEYVPSR